jgi:dUTP pyrophosphatase
MSGIEVKLKKLRDDALVPTYGSDLSAGADLYACIDKPVSIAPGKTAFLPTGLAIEIPEGFAGFVYARSGLASQKGLAPANKVGVIDSDYRGEIIVALHNHGDRTAEVAPFERIAQLIFAPVFTARFTVTDSLTDTARASGGFGSTGEK